MNSIQTLGIDELAKILQMTPKTVGEYVTRKPEALPPRVILPNCRRVLWRLVDVNDWLAARVQKTAGRPRKAV